MGKVAMIVKVMPDSPEVDLASMEGSIRGAVPETTEIRREPIGFGLNALKVAVVVEDEEGSSERVEEAIAGIDGVASAEIEELTLT